ncbi:MAG: class IV adenylate cyclase [Nanoarchaeota archaeon]
MKGPHVNIEFKARCSDLERVRIILKERGADFKGVDHQVDTYFNVRKGRLKLREGSIENHLIFYERQDTSGSKQSNVILFPTEPDSIIKSMLTKSNGILAVVDKKREIYFIDNVKFHLDTVEGLGSFVEVEAIDYEGSMGVDKLKAQCDSYQELLKIRSEDFIAHSYSDMILQGNL